VIKRIVASSLILALLVLTAVLLWGYRPGQSQAAYVAKVNGQDITVEQWVTAQKQAERARVYNAGYALTLQKMVDDLLLQQEATRRGTTCSTGDAVAQLKQNTQAVVDSRNAEILIQTAETEGDAPVGYARTPAAARTPQSSDVLAALQSDAQYIEATRRACTIGRLYDSLAPNGNTDERHAAIQALQLRLRSSANIQYASSDALTPISPDTSTAVPASGSPAPD
jgi:hypothetical protein